MCSAEAPRRPRGRGWLAALAVLLAGCGPEVPHGGVKTAADVPDEETPARRITEPVDLIPGDLDLVMRIDLSTVRDSLGTDTSDLLLERAAEVASAAGLVREALAKAEVVWLGLRMADVEAGDRVMVVRSLKERGEQEPVVAPDTIAWTEEPTEVKEVVRYVNKAAPARSGIERIYLFGKRAAVFVSPVQSRSVERVLDRGPDRERGEPAARGLVSLDYRTGRLSTAHENAYPSLAALVAGMVRVRATIDVVADELELEGRIQCRSTAAASKVHRFLETIVAATARRPDYADLLAGLKLAHNESVVSVQWPLPRTVIAALVGRRGADPSSPATRPSPPPPAPQEPRPESAAPASGSSANPAPAAKPPASAPPAAPKAPAGERFDFERPVDLPPPPEAGGPTPD